MRVKGCAKPAFDESTPDTTRAPATTRLTRWRRVRQSTGLEIAGAISLRRSRAYRKRSTSHVNVTARSGNPLVDAADAVILPAFSTSAVLELGDALAEVDRVLDGELARLAADARYTGKRGSTLVVPTLGRAAARRVVLAGVGEAGKLTSETIRRAWGAATT